MSAQKSGWIAEHTMQRLIVLGLTLMIAACESSEKPPLLLAGGGFIFNYRIAEVFYGVSVKPQRRFLADAVLEGEFENPAGGPNLIVRETLGAPKLIYALQTPPLRGVKAGKPYRVEVRLIEGGRITGRVERTYTSDLDQDMLPDAPLTIGPGYTPNPDLPKK
jgi:hypothetical protein